MRFMILKRCLKGIDKIIREQTLESWTTFSQLAGRKTYFYYSRSSVEEI